MWTVGLEMEELNPSEEGKNEGCLVVYLREVDDEGRQKQQKEFSAVGFVRRNSKNKKKKLKTVLEEQVAAAKEVADVINDNEIQVRVAKAAENELKRRITEAAQRANDADLSNGTFITDKVAEFSGNSEIL